MSHYPMRAVSSYSIAATTTAASGAAIPAGIRTVLLVAPAACYVTISPGANVPATTSATLIPPNFPMQFAVSAGDQISAITASGSSALSVTLLSPG